MHARWKSRRVMSSVIALLVSGALIALAGTASATPLGSHASKQVKKQFVVADVTEPLAVQYWDWVNWGIEHVAKQEGVKVVIFDDHSDVSQQIEETKTAIAQKVDGIILSPNNSPEAAAVLALAAKAHIPVVQAFIGSGGKGTYASFVTSADLQQGRAVGAYTRKLLGGKGELVCACLQLTRANAQAKLKGMKQTLGSGIKIVQIEQGKTYTIAETEQQVKDMLTAHPTAAVFAQYGDAALGAVAAVKALGKVPGKDVKIVVTDGGPTEVADVVKGEINADSVQQASGGGQKAMELMLNILHGRTVPHEVDLPEPVITKQNYAKMVGWMNGHIWPPGTKTG